MIKNFLTSLTKINKNQQVFRQPFNKSSLLKSSFTNQKFAFNFCSENQKNSQQDNEALFHEQLKRFADDLESGKLTQESLEKGTYKTIESEFNSLEQQISFELLNTQGLDDITGLYNKYIEQEKTLSADIHAIFLHFLANLKIDLTHCPEFKENLNKTLKGIQDLSPDHLRIFVWTLGNYIAHFQFGEYSSDHQVITIPDTYKQKLADQIMVHHEKFGYNFCIPLCYSCVNIFTGQQDFILLQEIVRKFAFLLSKNTLQLTVPEVVQFMMLFEKVDFGEIDIIEPYIDRLSHVLQDLNAEQLTQIVQVLSYLRYSNQEVIEDFYYAIHENMEDLKLKSACQVVFSMPNIYSKNDQMLLDILDLIAGSYKSINITQYVNLWLSLAKLRVDLKKYQRFLNVLIKSVKVNDIFSLNDLQPDEVISVLAACSALKINSKEFVASLVELLEPKYLQHHELFTLAMTFIVYVRQFTPFYTEIHQQCCFKYGDFSAQEKQQLKVAFQRVQSVLPPNSPFL